MFSASIVQTSFVKHTQKNFALALRIFEEVFFESSLEWVDGGRGRRNAFLLRQALKKSLF